MEIIIHQAILHVLDTTLQMLYWAQNELRCSAERGRQNGISG